MIFVIFHLVEAVLIATCFGIKFLSFVHTNTYTDLYFCFDTSTGDDTVFYSLFLSVSLFLFSFIFSKETFSSATDIRVFIQ